MDGIRRQQRSEKSAEKLPATVDLVKNMTEEEKKAPMASTVSPEEESGLIVHFSLDYRLKAKSPAPYTEPSIATDEASLLSVLSWVNLFPFSSRKLKTSRSN